MSRLNAKFMEDKLKYGWTLAQFAEHFEVDEQGFLRILETTFSSKATKAMISRLKRNDKKSKNLSTEKSSAIAVLNLEENFSESEEVEKTIDTTDSIIILQNLIAERRMLESSLNSLELEHQSLCSDRIKIKNSISSFKNKLIKLKEEIQTCQTEISFMLTQLKEKYATMQNLNSDISKVKVNLQEVNTKIKDLQKVSIFVYSNGYIEIESVIKIETPEWNEYFDKILKSGQADHFTVNQIKSLAQIFSITNFLHEQNLPYEIIFENEEMESFFKS